MCLKFCFIFLIFRCLSTTLYSGEVVSTNVPTTAKGKPYCHNCFGHGVKTKPDPRCKFGCQRMVTNAKFATYPTKVYLLYDEVNYQHSAKQEKKVGEMSKKVTHHSYALIFIISLFAVLTVFVIAIAVVLFNRKRNEEKFVHAVYRNPIAIIDKA